ncbi:hypothetical protein QVD17_24333 [Tagetes erecta]|uniref:Retrotransposon gag domain-containing protein n=1 Tax=Tagetes erecta TaxID=13708 RepID=A0AAD8NUT3_TARER|nr:hypothetical protein QVD17_24333 [Tagetes erecta]
MAGKRKGSARRPPTRRSTRTSTNKETVNTETTENYDNDGEEVMMTETQFNSAVADQLSKVLEATLPRILDSALQRRSNEGNRGGGGGSGGTEGTGGSGSTGGSDGTESGGNARGDGGTCGNDGGRIPKRGCLYKGFKDCTPKPFNGKGGAIATYNWISAMEAVINISECREDQAVKYAAHSFEEEAMHWWKTIVQRKGQAAIDSMRWNDMKELVLQQFYPQNELDKMEMEFLRLEAGSMTHREYTSKFNEMALLVPT